MREKEWLPIWKVVPRNIKRSSPRQEIVLGRRHSPSPLQINIEVTSWNKVPGSRDWSNQFRLERWQLRTEWSWPPWVRLFQRVGVSLPTKWRATTKPGQKIFPSTQEFNSEHPKSLIRIHFILLHAAFSYFFPYRFSRITWSIISPQITHLHPKKSPSSL